MYNSDFWKTNTIVLLACIHKLYCLQNLLSTSFAVMWRHRLFYWTFSNPLLFAMFTNLSTKKCQSSASSTKSPNCLNFFKLPEVFRISSPLKFPFGGTSVEIFWYAVICAISNNSIFFILIRLDFLLWGGADGRELVCAQTKPFSAVPPLTSSCKVLENCCLSWKGNKWNLK